MRRLTTAVATIGVVAIGVVVLSACGGEDATADTTPGTSTGVAPSSATNSTSSTVQPVVAPTTTPLTTDGSGHRPDVNVSVAHSGAVDPGMVLSGEHVVTSEEVFGATEAARDR